METLPSIQGKTVVASSWKHYQASKDTDGKSIADVVQECY
uniref:Uncharacterized protein n=1 Tax=Arundo donax TaxID=35708 RepID=A0A0A8ZKM9_ARUDO